MAETELSEFLKPGDYERLERTLLAKLKEHAASLREMLDELNGAWQYEDGLYRFYHQSFKVFYLQASTEKAVAALRTIAPQGRQFCHMFDEIIQTGTGRQFKMEDNDHWVERTGPIVQAFLHARYFIEMAARYATELDEPPQRMPSGWAALLCLYDLR